MSSIPDAVTTGVKQSLSGGSGFFSRKQTNLMTGATYYVIAYAMNSVGTGYGEELNFSTGVDYPMVRTETIAGITDSSATSGGNVTSDGGSFVTARGVCWSTDSIPTILNSHTSDGSGTGTFSSSISKLSGNTTIYIRAFATNSAGTAYGEQKQFNKEDDNDAFTDDRDGQVYNQITIGSQSWMSENLAYRGMSQSDADSSGQRDSGTVDGKLKESGTTHWNSPNTGATNACGFTALPGGNRNYSGDFNYLGNSADFWSSFGGGETNTWNRGLTYSNDEVGRDFNSKSYGFSVRCLQY